MQRTISPFLLILQIVAVSMLIGGAAFLVNRFSEDSNGVQAILYFDAAALVIPAYQLYVWAYTVRKAANPSATGETAGHLRDVEDGMQLE